MTTLSEGGAIAAGLSLVVLAGSLNGSWNASFSSSTLSRIGCAVDEQLVYPLAWILYQIYAVAINIPICIYWSGGLDRVQYVVQESSASDIFLVVLFSILWGVGSLGFGVACQIAGVGLGTNLTMGVIMVLGTFLPLCLDGAIGTAAGGIVIAGLVVCCLGLVLSVQSLQLRDAEERAKKVLESQERIKSKGVEGAVQESSVEDDKELQEPKGTIDDGVNAEVESEAIIDTNEDDQEGPSTLYKVATCIIAGIFASQLQFAFVLGDGITEIAKGEEGPGSTPPSGTSAVIWLFAISLGAPVSIIYGICNRPSEIPLSRLYHAPWYRHLLIIITTSLPWVAHIHLYGYANTYLSDGLGASVAWPILMMTTVLTGMFWSMGLGEWKLASTMVKLKLYQGLALVTIGVTVIMSSMAV